jgi:hypothetical protein
MALSGCPVCEPSPCSGGHWDRAIEKLGEKNAEANLAASLRQSAAYARVFHAKDEPPTGLGLLRDRAAARPVADPSVTLALIAEHRLSLEPYGRRWRCFSDEGPTMAAGDTIGDAVRACVARIKEEA